MAASPSVKFILLLLLSSLALAQQTDPVQTPLKLDTLLNLSRVEAGLTYYTVNFELKKDQAKLFLITVETEQSESIQIYTSIYYDGVKEYNKYPTYQNNTNSCSYSSIDTCALALPQVKQGESKNITVYIGVELFFADQMTILAALEDIYPLQIGIVYDIDFQLWESAVMTLQADQVNMYEQVIIQMQYDNYKDIGRFAMYAGIDQIPHGYKNRIQSKYMGAFTQILILEPLEQNSTYYIVLEGEQGSEFDLSVKPFSTSAPTLQMNHTVFYYSSGSGQKDYSQMNFSLPINYKQEQQILPLLVDLNSLGGYGQFAVDYCDGLTNFTFENLSGESGEIIIPVQERKQCYQTLSTAGGLLIENLIVSIRNVPWYFSFSIGVFQGQFPLVIAPYSQKMGTLVSTQTSRSYEIQSYLNQSFVLKFKTITGEKQLNFTLYECKQRMLGMIESCKKIMDSKTNAIPDPTLPQYKQFNFTCQEKKTYKLVVSHSQLKPIDSEYVVLLLPLNPKPYNLSPSKPVYSIISKNQYQYYVINLTLIQKQSNITIDNNTNVVITLTEKNGDCMMLTSLFEKNPKFEQVFESNSTVDYSWNGKKEYSVNPDTEAIYVAVLGEKESIYHLQVAISANEQVPESYTKLVSDKMLSFNLSSELGQDHILLSYTAHSIPYTIIISPSPACVIYSYSLPFTNNSCRELPTQITEKTIYLKVFRKLQKSKDDSDFKFVVYVYSGSHYLFEYTPIMIACKDQCYEYVTVFVPQKIKIVHKGMGYIGHKNSTEAFSNQKMEITCDKTYPCFLTINASLPYGGNMELFYDSVDVQEIEWMNKPLTFNSAFSPKLFYMQIRSWNSLNTAIFYTEGISVTVYYNIYSMNESATNALEYGFPNSYNYMKKSSGNPLRRFHIVEFDQKMIKELGCEDENDLCIATLAVYPNTLGEYSTEYVNKSIGYFSCNTYEYYIPMNSPYQLAEEYSLVYFSHELTEEEKKNMPPFYYVRVQPVSSCRPQIFAPFSQNDKNVSFTRDMPHYGLYTIDSNTLDKKNPQIEFSISTDTPCEYTLWVLDSDIYPVIENANYEFTSDKDGMVVFAYSDKYLWSDKKFSLEFDQQMNEIVIGKYQKLSNGSLKLPSISDSLAYITQANTLQYNSEQFLSTLYIVKASTNANSKVNLKVSANQAFTTIMTNSVHQYTFSAKANQVSYRYFSNSDFLMFVTTDFGTVRVTVTDYRRDNDRTFSETLINQNSDPWITVKAEKNQIREYVITLENVLLMNGNIVRNLQQSDQTRFPKVNLHIEETGTLGLPQLYEGVALFDAFYSDDGLNCYKYVSEAIVGRHSLDVDIIFGTDFINNVPQLRSRVSIQEGNTRVNSTLTKLATGYRLSTEYYSSQVYSICFSINDQPTLVGKQFYVMVENMEYSLRHLTLDQPLSDHDPDSYSIYQYVATQDQYVMVEVVNCFGTPTLLGAQNYQDISLGQVSQLGSFYRDDTMSVAKAKINMGYFYFAIKQDSETDRYKIRVQLINQTENLHYDKFSLKQTTITQAKSVEENGRQKVRVTLPPVTFANTPKSIKVHHVTYNLLVDDLKEKQEYPSSVVAKCPVLGNRNLSSYKFVQNMSQSVKIDGAGQEEIRIDIPTAQVPENFNLTGFVEVSISEPHPQTLTYYYESSSFVLKNTYHPTGGVSAFTIVFIIMMFISGAVLIFVVYRRWRKQKSESRVAFEMANYNYQNNTTEKPVEKPINESPSRPLKKALNENLGYGQFVDQSM